MFTGINTGVAAEIWQECDLLRSDAAVEDTEKTGRTVFIRIAERVDREIGETQTALALMIGRALSVIDALGADAGNADEIVGALVGVRTRRACSVDTKVGGTLIVVGTRCACSVDAEIGRTLIVAGAVGAGVVETEIAFTLGRIGAEGRLDERRGRRLVGRGRGGGIIGAGGVSAVVTGDVVWGIRRITGNVTCNIVR